MVESHSKRANTDEISGKPVKNPKIDEKNETKTEEKNTEPGKTELRCIALRHNFIINYFFVT